MKKFSISLFVLLSFIITGGCNNQKDEIADYSTSSAERIIQDPLYGEYRTQEFNNQKNIVEGNYDLKGIGNVIISRNQSVCSIPDELFASLKGGLSYKDIHCKLYNVIDQLKNRYPGFENLDQKVLMDRYIQDHPDFKLKLSSLGVIPRREIKE